MNLLKPVRLDLAPNSPERFRSLQVLAPPTNDCSQRRVLGLFAYYVKRRSNFSEMIQPLLKVTTFALISEAINAFNLSKSGMDDMMPLRQHYRQL